MTKAGLPALLTSHVFEHEGQQAVNMLDDLTAWASRSKLAPFVRLARTIGDKRDSIVAALARGLSNARIEAANTKLRLFTRLAFGFPSHEPRIALAMLELGGLGPPLPGRR